MARRRTSSAISWGWLCSSGGSGCTSTGQPRRSTIVAAGWARGPPATRAGRAAGWARAPQATSAVRGSAAEAELVDEEVVEVGAVGELDIGHLLQQGLRAGPLADREQGHLRALAGHIAGRDDPQHRELWHQAD